MWSKNVLFISSANVAKKSVSHTTMKIATWLVVFFSLKIFSTKDTPKTCLTIFACFSFLFLHFRTNERQTPANQLLTKGESRRLIWDARMFWEQDEGRGTVLFLLEWNGSQMYYFPLTLPLLNHKRPSQWLLLHHCHHHHHQQVFSSKECSEEVHGLGSE